MPQDRQESLDALQTQVDIQFVNKRLLLDVTRSTTLIYGDLRARLFEKYAPGAKRKKGMRPEELTDPVTSKKLGIQENDLWIAAQAIERNLVLVSNDAMKRIRSVAPELQVENWAQTEE
jgi:predicted nucleic acid-binding protein